jgi:hypothetical protein
MSCVEKFKTNLLEKTRKSLQWQNNFVMEQVIFVIENLLMWIYDDSEIVIEHTSHLTHHDKSSIFVTKLLLFDDKHIFRHVTARLLWLVNIVTNFVMKVTTIWRRACWQLMWLSAMLATDVVHCHTGCWRGSVPCWTLTWLRAPGQWRVLIWLVHVSPIVGVLDRQTYLGGTRGSRLCGEDHDDYTSNSKLKAGTRDRRFIQVWAAEVASPTSCLGYQVWPPALGVGLVELSCPPRYPTLFYIVQGVGS